MRFAVVGLAIGLLLLFAEIDAAHAQETLVVSFTPTSAGGSYSPKNIDVVWIENSGGAFVRTIGRWANSRRSHLIAWRAAAGTTDVDAVSGATMSSYVSLTTMAWNMTDTSGSVVPDGTYTIRIESCDSNASSASQNHQGTFTFVKNGTASTQMVSGDGFNNVTITYSGRPVMVDAGVDMGPPPVDMGPLPVDMGPLPEDMGPPPVDMGPLPVDMGISPEDMGAQAIDMGAIEDAGSTPSDAAITPGAAPRNTALVGTCATVGVGSDRTSGALGSLSFLATLAALVWMRRRPRTPLART